MRQRTFGFIGTTVVFAGVVLLGAGRVETGLADAGPVSTIRATASTPGGGGGGDATGGGGGSGGEAGDSGVGQGCEPWVTMGWMMSPDDVPTLLPVFRTGAYEAMEESSEGTATPYMRLCPSGPEYAWVPDGLGAAGPPPPTVDDLWPGAYDEAVAGIPPPVPEISPPGTEEIPGIVNVGLWLAVEEPEPVVARAEAGSVWAQAEASLVGLTWEMSTGDVVECEGFGDPIGESREERDTAEPSPVCGYVFEQPSTPEHTGAGSAYGMSVMAHWQVRVTGSDGRDVLADPVDVVHEFDYVVAEVQTVGQG